VQADIEEKLRFLEAEQVLKQDKVAGTAHG
jgi:hypothetical protein